MKPLKNNIKKILLITTNYEFFYRRKFFYRNLESLKIDNVSVSNFDNINDFFTKFDIIKLKFLHCNFTYNNIKISLSKNNNGIELGLHTINSSGFDILNNLPNFINILNIEYPLVSNNIFYLDNVLSNLPPLLEKISIKIPPIYQYKKIKDYESNGYLNALFGIKIPYGCMVEVDLLDIKY